MSAGPLADPIGNYFFALEIDGVEVAHFTECSGLKSRSQVFEIEEGGLNGRTHKRVGQSEWDNIVLRYASSASTFMLAWRDRFLQDQFANAYGGDSDGAKGGSGAIKIIDNNGQDVVRTYSFKAAWPVSWEGPAFNSGSSELAIESLEIAHTGLTIR